MSIRSFRTSRSKPLGLMLAALAAVIVTMAMPSTNIPILKAATPTSAHASSPTSCITLGRNLVGFASSGNAWLAFNAVRRVPGCGDFNASAICWASRQWWGGFARYIVRIATWGQYDRC